MDRPAGAIAARSPSPSRGEAARAARRLSAHPRSRGARRPRGSRGTIRALDTNEQSLERDSPDGDGQRAQLCAAANPRRGSVPSSARMPSPFQWTSLTRSGPWICWDKSAPFVLTESSFEPGRFLVETVSTRVAFCVETFAYARTPRRYYMWVYGATTSLLHGSDQSAARTPLRRTPKSRSPTVVKPVSTRPPSRPCPPTRHRRCHPHPG